MLTSPHTRLGMSTRNKERGAIYAWQMRTAPIYIYIIMQMERKDVRYVESTIKVLELANRLLITYLLRRIQY